MILNNDQSMLFQISQHCRTMYFQRYNTKRLDENSLISNSAEPKHVRPLNLQG